MQVWKDTNNRLSRRQIDANKAKGIIGSQVFFYEELTSTFDKIKELELKDGLTVVCAKQTSGSGRLGRSWESSLGGVYFTFAIKDISDKFSVPFITLVCALGVCKALGDYLPCQIKWPNDIVHNGRKLCGILTKNLVSAGKVDTVLVGIGINVNNSFSVNLPYAASVKSVTGKEEDENTLLFKVLDSIDEVYCCLTAEQVLKEYKENCVNLGREVTLVYEGKEVRGICRDIFPDGSMEVSSGMESFAVNSGEVSVKGIYTEGK